MSTGDHPGGGSVMDRSPHHSTPTEAFGRCALKKGVLQAWIKILLIICSPGLEFRSLIHQGHGFRHRTRLRAGRNAIQAEELREKLVPYTQNHGLLSQGLKGVDREI